MAYQDKPDGPARASALLQLFGEHHQDSAGAAQVGEFVNILVGGHAPKRVIAVFRCDRRCVVDVVDGERDAVHTNLVRKRRLRLDRIRMNVHEEFKAPMAVRRLKNRDLGVVAIEANGSISRLTTDSIAAEDSETEVGEKRDGCFDIALRRSAYVPHP